jgi:hypothetical protein
LERKEGGKEKRRKKWRENGSFPPFGWGGILREKKC